MASCSLHPRDVAVALALVGDSGARYQALASVLHMSPSTAHASVRRLQHAGLVFDGERRVNRLLLLEFLVHGVRYAFATRPGRVRLGVPTAHAGPVLEDMVQGDPYVWPSPNGTIEGRAIEPLLPAAPIIASESQALYALLSLVDVMRVGRTRERAIAERALRERLLPASATALVRDPAAA